MSQVPVDARKFTHTHTRSRTRKHAKSTYRVRRANKLSECDRGIRSSYLHGQAWTTTQFFNHALKKDKKISEKEIAVMAHRRLQLYVQLWNFGKLKRSLENHKIGNEGLILLIA